MGRQWERTGLAQNSKFAQFMNPAILLSGDRLSSLKGKQNVASNKMRPFLTNI